MTCTRSSTASWAVLVPGVLLVGCTVPAKASDPTADPTGYRGGYEVGHCAQVIGLDHTRAVAIWTPGTSIGDLRDDVTRSVDESR